MYDVRFYVDSIFTRICKFIIFGVMVALVSLGSLYDAILSGGSSRAFHGLALLMFGTRMLWIIQYGIVLYFVKVFDKTLVPMCLTMGVYFCAGIGFLATYIAGRHTWYVTGSAGKTDVRVWYVLIGLEACAIIGISMSWRILSFIHTHLVERLSLLSLIIMGEGIIGLVKSTSYSIQGMNVSIWKEGGIVGCGILIIYLIYILYFDNVDHHGFGTIGQQLWTLLHFPTHVAILLTVEGSTALTLWYACRSGLHWIEERIPNVRDPKSMAKFVDNNAFVEQISNTYNTTMNKFKYKALDDYYPYDSFTKDLSKLQKTNATFGTPEWSSEVGKTMDKMCDYFHYFVYQNFGAEGPVYKLKKEQNYGERVKLYDAGYRFVLVYYYISAGILLLLFATLVFFGQKRKSASNWWSIAIRVTAGLCLPIGIVIPLLQHNDSLENYRDNYTWMIIPVVAFGYLFVLLIDNVAKIVSERSISLVEGARAASTTSVELKHGPAVEVAHESDDEDGYEMNRTTRHIVDDLESGLTQASSEKDKQIMKEMEAGPTIFQERKASLAGYSRVQQDDHGSP